MSGGMGEYVHTDPRHFLELTVSCELEVWVWVLVGVRGCDTGGRTGVELLHGLRHAWRCERGHL